MVSWIYAQIQGREKLVFCEGDLRPQRERKEGGRRKDGREEIEGKRGEKEGGDQGRQERKKRMKAGREEEGGKEGSREPTEFLTEQYSRDSHRMGFQMCYWGESQNI